MEKPTMSVPQHTPDTAIPLPAILDAPSSVPSLTLLLDELHRLSPALLSTLEFFSHPGASSSSLVEPPDLRDLGIGQPEKRRIICEHVVWLTHMEHYRGRAEHQAGIGAPPSGCLMPLCRKMNALAEHGKQCTAGNHCLVGNCAFSKRILGHCETCTLDRCSVCEPLNSYYRYKAKKPADRALSDEGIKTAHVGHAPVTVGSPQQPSFQTVLPGTILPCTVPTGSENRAKSLLTSVKELCKNAPEIAHADDQQNCMVRLSNEKPGIETGFLEYVASRPGHVGPDCGMFMKTKDATRDNLPNPSFRLGHGCPVTQLYFTLPPAVYTALMQNPDHELELACYDHTGNTRWPASLSVVVNGTPVMIQRRPQEHRPLYIKELCQENVENGIVFCTTTVCCCAYRFVLHVVHRSPVKKTMLPFVSGIDGSISGTRFDWKTAGDTGTTVSVKVVVVSVSHTAKIPYDWKPWIPKRFRCLQRTPWQCKFAVYIAALIIAGVLLFLIGFFAGTRYN